MTFRYHRTYHGKLQAVLLDWAGTTMDFGCIAPAVVFVEVFKRKGVPISMEEARAPMGAHKRVHIERITELESVRRRWQEKHGRLPNDGDVEAMFKEFVPLQLRVPVRLLPADPGRARRGDEAARPRLSRSAQPPVTTGDDEDQPGRRQEARATSRTRPSAPPTCRPAGPIPSCACRTRSTSASPRSRPA